MKTLEYEITTWKKSKVKMPVEDDNFIVVRSQRDGSNFYTAFIGKGEGNRYKLQIEVSPSGGFLNIKRMYGDANLNAISLLKAEKRNTVISKQEFKRVLKINDHFLHDVLNIIKNKKNAT